jgi:hypothetical protein
MDFELSTDDNRIFAPSPNLFNLIFKNSSVSELSLILSHNQLKCCDMLSLVIDAQKSQTLKISLDFNNNCINKEELSKISIQLMQKVLLYEAFLYKIYAKVLEIENLMPELKVGNRRTADDGNEKSLESPSFR